jgi:hypothetical protein
MARKMKKGENCAYCGVFTICTRDHVFPRTIFTLGQPNNHVIVPACKKCNNEKSKFDNALRDFLCVDLFGRNTSFARRVNLESLTILIPKEVKGSVIRSAKAGRSQFISALLRSPKEVSLEIFQEGLYEQGVSSDEASDLVIESLKWIAKGLFFCETDTLLRIEDFFAQRMFPAKYELFRESYIELTTRKIVIGNNTVHCSLCLPNEKSDTFVIHLVLWECVCFFIAVNCANKLDEDMYEPLKK